MEDSRNPILPGIALFVLTLLALFIANSKLNPWYLKMISYGVPLGFNIVKPVNICVNEGLMSIFFMYIGLEIKRERISGIFKKNKAILVPGVAAIFGVIVPAIIYLVIAPKKYYSGWAIPTATDIAFSLAICSLLGHFVPKSFRMLLMSIAIFDDLMAVFIIAVFYSSGIYLPALLIALLLAMFIVFLKKRWGINLFLYIVLGFCLWLAVVKSGLHSTVAGFIVGFMAPEDKIDFLENKLYEFVSFLVMPIFAFVNSGVNLTTVSLKLFMQPVALGIMLGLILGKPIGIFIGVKLFPDHGYSNKAILALGLLCGIGFTMSLFIGSLAFDSEITQIWVKFGVLFASGLMGLAGYCMLKIVYGGTNERN